MISTIDFTPDWISALTAVAALVIALPSLLITIKQLVKKDNAQDEMIRSLASQVKELSKQTVEFEKQTQVMSSTLTVYQEMLSISSKSLSFKEEEIKTRKIVEAKEKRKLIMPRFKEVSLAIHDDYQVRFVVRNEGDAAFHVTFKDISEVKLMNWFVDIIHVKTQEAINIDLESNSCSFEVSAGQVIHLEGHVDKFRARGNINKIDFILALEFEDREGNRYRQQIAKEEGNKFSMEEEPTVIKIAGIP